MRRRSITLIFACWVTPDLSSSWSCLCLDIEGRPQVGRLITASRILRRFVSPASSHISLLLPDISDRYAALRGMDCQAMAQMKPNSSRATAVMTLPDGLPRAVKC